MEPLLMVATLAAIAAVVYGLTVKYERRTILDYQRGLRSMGGHPREILGPGSYRFRPSKEQITVVDLRDQPLVVERFAYRDSAGENAWVSALACIRVADVSRATEQSADHVNEAVVLIRDVLRASFSARRAIEARRDRRDCEQELKTRLAEELEKIGLALTALEITEVSNPATERLVASRGLQ